MWLGESTKKKKNAIAKHVLDASGSDGLLQTKQPCWWNVTEMCVFDVDPTISIQSLFFLKKDLFLL